MIQLGVYVLMKKKDQILSMIMRHVKHILNIMHFLYAQEPQLQMEDVDAHLQIIQLLQQIAHAHWMMKMKHILKLHVFLTLHIHQRLIVIQVLFQLKDVFAKQDSLQKDVHVEYAQVIVIIQNAFAKKLLENLELVFVQLVKMDLIKNQIV